MAKRVIDDSTLTPIADKIREHSDSTDLIKPSDFADKIDDVYSRGVLTGFTDGYGQGRVDGNEKGKITERDTFWKNYIATMTSNYNSYYAFAGFGWNNNTFRPTRDMYIYNATNMFSMSQITDLAGILEEQGVHIDFSGCSQFNSFAYDSKITHFPAISTVSASSLHGMFDYCYDTHTIDKLTLKSDGLQTFNYTFRSCTKLENIIISGTVSNSFDIRWSPLTKESIKSVISALSDTVTGKAVTFKKTAVEAALPHIFAATFSNETQILDTIGTENFDYVILAMGIGDYAEIGEYVYISFADTNVVLQKTGDSVQEASGINEGEWSLIAYGTDIKDEWGELVSSKPNWTISLV